MTTPEARLAAALSDRYHIEGELGQGGMATVYLAEDLKHARKVAIKVLHPELSAVIGGERFLAEIKTTASLQHPHILGLIDSGDADGLLYYVMPFIEGETLRGRLTREKQLPVDDAIRLTKEVASALEFAHKRGIVHRDIKPENILLQDGQALVADFGIALAVQQAGGSRMTQTGMSLGTPAYMSPEQAMGERELGARSDVYALGAMTYEMLTGEPPFTGPNSQAIVAKVLTETPRPLRPARPSVSPGIEGAVLTALQKLPADRFNSAKDYADALDGKGTYAATVATRLSAYPPGLLPAHPPARLGRALAIAAAAALLAATVTWAVMRIQTPDAPVTRYGLALPPSQAMAPGSVTPMPSPDGSSIVYLGPGPAGDQLWMKRRDSYTAVPIAGTNGTQTFTFSPSGEWIAIATAGQLKKVPITGGTAVPLVTDSVGGGYGVAWLDNGTIVYSLRGAAGLMQVPENGGKPEQVWRSPSYISMLPSPLPGGHAVLFVSCPAGCSQPQLWVADLKTKAAHMLLQDGTAGEYVKMGHIIFSSLTGALYAVAFDPGSLRVTGTPIPLGEQLSTTDQLQMFHVSAAGTLVLTTGGANITGRTYDMVWVDRNGRETPVDPDWRFQLTALANNHGWSLSPDGKKLAVGVSTHSGDDIWVKPLPHGAAYRVSFDPMPDNRPRWTADGRYVTFVGVRQPGGVFRHRADGTGTDSLLVEGVMDEAMMSPDGRWLLLRQGSVGAVAGGRNITGMRLGTDTAPVPILATEFDEEAVQLSPDGKWLAYQSDETGRTEVFVRPFPSINDGKKQVSSGGGLAPLWSRDGKELFYLASDRNMMAAKMLPGTSPEFAPPVTLFHVPDELLGVEALYYTPWDVAADGRFIMARLVSGDPGQLGALVVTENWFQELEAKVKR